MSGTVQLTIGGASNGQNGVVSVPSALLFGAQADTTSLNGLLQTYLKGLTTGILSSADSFENNDLAGGLDTIHAASGTADATVELFSNVSPASVTAAGSGSYSNVSVTSGVTDLAVQVPGNVTLAGVGATTQAIFGANSNVDYSVLDPAAGSIYLAGGSNSITLGNFLTNNAETIYSAGSDSINLKGQGTDYVSVYGNAVVNVEAANAYVTAEGNATTNLYWDNAAAGGSLHFINNSSAAARIQIGVFFDSVTGAPLTSASHVTAYGGAGGGLYVGGSAGNNSLVGGTGAVTLVGAGNGDYLEGNSSLPGKDGSGNDFFAGAGTETMVATSTTGANLFQVGLQYPGLGLTAGTGVISTSGSGQQTFFLGNSPGETIYGSTHTGANYNLYNFISDSVAGAGGGTFDIYNFNASNSVIDLVNSADNGPGDAHVLSMGADANFAGQYDITLSDHTTIRLHNFTGSLSTATITGGITSIY
jgi:hypothetical protein